MRVTKIVKFDAAHRLPNYQGKCANLHGHTWTLEVSAEGKRDPISGMVMDFSEMQTFLEPIIARLDHGFLNDIIPLPTCENLLIAIGEMLSCNGFPWLALKLWESPDSFAVYLRKEQDDYATR